MPVWQGASTGGIDLSGLGRQPGQLTPMPVPGFENEGTDDMRVGLSRREVATAANRPVPSTVAIKLVDYVPDLNRGFEEIYRMFIAHFASLTATPGPLTAFAEDKVRVLRRSTVEYGAVLNTSLHPDLIRDGLDLDRHFDRLWRRTALDPTLAAFVPHERMDLWNNDIPVFWASAAGRAVQDSVGEVVPVSLDSSALDAVLTKAGKLCEGDLARQLWLMQASVQAASTDLERGSPIASVLVADPPPDAVSPADRAVAHAVRLADRLGELAYISKSDISWIGPYLSAGTKWRLGRLGPDLCTGIGGIALFLATLASITEEGRHARWAELAANTVRAQLERGDLQGQGGMAGLGGALYVLTRLGCINSDDRLLDAAERLIEDVESAIKTDLILDIIGGAAGSIGGLLALYTVRPADRILHVLKICAERLVDQARPVGDGVGWLPATFTAGGLANLPLSGFAHGNAGVAWALIRTGYVLRDQRFISVARAGLRYERSLFDPQEQNWLDLRRDPGTPAAETPPKAFMTAWCHGAAGIGLSRLAMQAGFADDRLEDEIQTAVGTVWRNGFGANHSLCHGDLGNVDFLIQAQATDDQRNKALRRIVASVDQFGGIPGTPLGVETPGLLTGSAGIGYGLLRAARPNLVPSVLTLQAFPDRPVADDTVGLR